MSDQELHLKYRPRTLDEMIGQPGAVAAMRKMLARIPHACLFHGGTGTGKTTLAGIITNALGCTVRNRNLTLVNAASDNGVDSIRKMEGQLQFRGLGKQNSPARCWVWNEAHLLTNEAQSALLDIIEDPLPHCYFVFTTTHPNKMLPALRGRCTQVEVKEVGLTDLKAHALKVSKLEKPKVPLQKAVIDKLAEKANGSVRKLLKDLEVVLPMADEKGRLNAISDVEEERAAIDLCRLLFDYKKKPTWAEAIKIVRTITGDAEKIRWAVLGYANAIILKGAKNEMAFAVIEAFRDNWYDCKMSGLLDALRHLCR